MLFLVITGGIFALFGLVLMFIDVKGQKERTLNRKLKGWERY